MAFSPRNIVGCLLKKRLTKWGSRAPQDPPSYTPATSTSAYTACFLPSCRPSSLHPFFPFFLPSLPTFSPFLPCSLPPFSLSSFPSPYLPFPPSFLPVFLPSLFPSYCSPSINLFLPILPSPFYPALPSNISASPLNIYFLLIFRRLEIYN